MILLSVLVCLAAFWAVVLVLRRERVSLGLPVAYLASLLLIHVPGAIAHLLDRDGILLYGREFTRIGIGLTATGAACFAAGVWLAHRGRRPASPQAANRTSFVKFCLFGGAAATMLTFVLMVPSIGAVIQRGGFIWMLGITLALRSTIRLGERKKTWQWIAALSLYPVLMLLLGGFMSYGVAAMITVLSAIVVTARSHWRVAAGCVVASVVGMSVFFGYFQNRKEIREAVWGGASASTRIDASLGAARDIGFFDPANKSHLHSLDARLNQNYFAGLAAARLKSGETKYLKGGSVRDALLSVIPRALWPDKPIIAGSGTIVSEMTGLQLARNTSWGVGNVMEFYINFGIYGIIGGFLILGLGLGRLDRLIGEADVEGRLGQTIFYYLPAVSLIQPNGSMVEMAGSAVSALAASLMWRWAWQRWPKTGAYRPLVGHTLAHRSS